MKALSSKSCSTWFRNAIAPYSGRAEASRCRSGLDKAAQEVRSTGRISSSLIVEFSDTGCGIRPDQIGHIFELAFSGVATLPDWAWRFCERIMKQHWRADFRRQLLSIQALDSRSISPYTNWSWPRHEQHSLHEQRISVLVVDDEPGMRTALRANFLRHGWRVETANGVRDAARAFELTSFDLVVSRHPHEGWRRL